MTKRLGIVLATVGALLLGSPEVSGADTAAAGRHEQCLLHLKKVAAGISAGSLADPGTLKDWERDRVSLRLQLLDMLGLNPPPERTPLRAEITGSFERAAYRVENVVFQSRPGLYVTGNFYLPKGAATPMPAVIYVCGHDPHPKGAKVRYQDRAAWFAEHGYACLILDTLEFGEVPGLHHGIHDLNLWNWLSRGYTPAGVEVWNTIRAVDYLETRSEVDRNRIGLTGISGGGATTWFTAAVDERIAVAVPVCATYTFGSQAAHWVAAGQCDCIYFNNTYLIDFPVVAALIAPRPLLICSGRKDGDFPPDGYHEVYRRAKRVYDLYGEAVDASKRGTERERIREVDDDVGHTDAPLFRQAARQWMNRWLRGDTTPVPMEPNPVEPREEPATLACLRSPPPGAANYRIHDEFVPVAPAPDVSLTPEEWRVRRGDLLRRLDDMAFRWFPREAIPFQTRVGRDSGGWAARYADCKDVTFETEPGVAIRARLFKPRGISERTPLLILVKRPGDSIYAMDLDELLPVLGRHTVLVLYPRLTEHPVAAAEYAEIERTCAWVGRTVASLQVWEILRAVEWALAEEKIPCGSVTLYGRGGMGILSVYAGLRDSRIGRIVLKEPPVSHRDGPAPALLNVLRITDIPEVLGAFAPRRLVVVGAMPAAFDASRAIYALQGAAEKMGAAGSLPEALEIWRD
ncbi:MAG: alpha/beta hydrolase [Limisphaerales bacterium]